MGSCTPGIKYWLKPSTSVSYEAPTITNIEKTYSGSYFDAIIKWNQMYGIDGYEVYLKTGSGSWKKLLDASEYSTGVKLYNYKKNVTYKIRVRTVKKSSSVFNFKVF